MRVIYGREVVSSLMESLTSDPRLIHHLESHLVEERRVASETVPDRLEGDMERDGQRVDDEDVLQHQLEFHSRGGGPTHLEGISEHSDDSNPGPVAPAAEYLEAGGYGRHTVFEHAPSVTQTQQCSLVNETALFETSGPVVVGGGEPLPMSFDFQYSQEVRVEESRGGRHGGLCTIPTPLIFINGVWREGGSGHGRGLGYVKC